MDGAIGAADCAEAIRIRPGPRVIAALAPCGLLQKLPTRRGAAENEEIIKLAGRAARDRFPRIKWLWFSLHAPQWNASFSEYGCK